MKVDYKDKGWWYFRLVNSGWRNPIPNILFFFLVYTPNIFAAFTIKWLKIILIIELTTQYLHWLHRLNTFSFSFVIQLNFESYYFPFQIYFAKWQYLNFMRFIHHLLVSSPFFLKRFSEHWVTLPLIPNKLYTQQSHHMKFIETIFLPEFIHWITLE